MFEWQNNLINTNLVKLIKETSCSITFLAEFQASETLSEPEVDDLKSMTSKIDQAHEFYRIIRTRENWFKHLLEALKKTNQSGPLSILNGSSNSVNEVLTLTFDKENVLGTGSNGTIVFKGKFGRQCVAVKRMLLSVPGNPSLEHEVNILKACDMHDNIVRYIGSNKTSDFLFIFLELCDTTLKKWIESKYKEITHLDVLKQVTIGLEWLHEQRIIHRDLKPDNIMLTLKPIRVKISDFGLSRSMEEGRSFYQTSNSGGTEGWMAPEVHKEAVQGTLRQYKFTVASDIFALGCVFYYVLTGGQHPFGELHRSQNNILDGKLKIKENAIQYDCAKNIVFIKLMISKDPNTRPTCQALLSCPIFWSLDRRIRFIQNLAIHHKAILDSTFNVKLTAFCKYDHSEEKKVLLYFNDKLPTTAGCAIPFVYLKNQSNGRLQQYYNSSNGFIWGFRETQQITIDGPIRKPQSFKNQSSYMEPSIGIDLGTTHCCVGVYSRDKVIIIPNQSQLNTKRTPSYLEFSENGSKLVSYGTEAKHRAHTNPENTIYDVKLIIGKRFMDCDLQNDMKLWPFTVAEGTEGRPMIKVGANLHQPQAMSALLLSRLRRNAEEFLRINSIKKAVITVPAYFDKNQRQATHDAGLIAGFEDVQLLTELAAAAIAYKSTLHTSTKRVLIYDLGKVSFDASIMNVDSGIDVIAIGGEKLLGGDDFKQRLMKYCEQQFECQHGLKIVEGKYGSSQANSTQRINRLQSMCKQAMRALSTSKTTIVELDAFYEGKDLRVPLTREMFNALNDADFRKTIDVIDNALKGIGMQKEEIDEIILVGGSTRIPRVRELLARYFGKVHVNDSIDPNETIAHGAALQASIVYGTWRM